MPSRGSSEIALWTVDVPEGGDETPHRASKEEVFYVLSGSVTIQGQTAGAGDAIVVPPDTELALTGEPARVLVATSVGIEGTLADGRRRSRHPGRSRSPASGVARNGAGGMRGQTGASWCRPHVLVLVVRGRGGGAARCPAERGLPRRRS
ncbi:cupin domain-containing protein, partial [Lentzea sp. NPDC059081]|uniref:cupin domain-containing protein n=1 Tax=Lentzea sp. NPDC059081 TaxID=3346719 RepID=UPI00368911C3